MVRRRNGKRGKGMATKKEKTKEQRIKTEKTRLKGIFKDLDEQKKIGNAADRKGCIYEH